jgi:glycopeptide antibiotics resistance protein
VREKQSRPREYVVLVVLFVVYLVLLAWIVLWKLEVPWIGEAALLPRPIKLVPFLASGDAGASAPLEVVVNLALFVPFGIYLGLLAPSWRWWNSALVFVGASLILETAQHLLSVGSFDITDVIVNTAGGLAGFGLLALVRRRLGARGVAVVTRVCVGAAAVLVLAVALYIASPLHFAAQRDVVVTRPGSGHTR